MGKFSLADDKYWTDRVSSAGNVHTCIVPVPSKDNDGNVIRVFSLVDSAPRRSAPPLRSFARFARSLASLRRSAPRDVVDGEKTRFFLQNESK